MASRKRNDDGRGEQVREGAADGPTVGSGYSASSLPLGSPLRQLVDDAVERAGDESDESGSEAVSGAIRDRCLTLASQLDFVRELPEVQATPDGCLELEWFESHQHTVLVLVDADAVHWSAVLRGVRSKGSEAFESRMPSSLASLLENY